jgi:hypothetical protein
MWFGPRGVFVFIGLSLDGSTLKLPSLSAVFSSQLCGGDGDFFECMNSGCQEFFPSEANNKIGFVFWTT